MIGLTDKKKLDLLWNHFQDQKWLQDDLALLQEEQRIRTLKADKMTEMILREKPKGGPDVMPEKLKAIKDRIDQMEKDGDL